MDSNQSSASERMWRAHNRILESFGTPLEKLPIFVLVKKYYDVMVKRAEKLGATPEEYVAAQFDGVRADLAGQMTATYLHRKAGDCNKAYERYKRKNRTAGHDFLEADRYYRTLVVKTARMRGCGVYDVVNDINFTLPAWFRVRNSNDQEIIDMHRQQALVDESRPEFMAVEERLGSVHG